MIGSSCRAGYALALLGLGLAWGCLSSDPAGPRVDSVSHFLSACLGDEDCPGELHCLCHVCTTRCSTVDACSDLSPTAVCVDGSSDGFCSVGLGAQVDLCGVRCDDGARCPDGLECRSGLCAEPFACPEGTTWDTEAGYCVTPWTAIPVFVGNQVCGPDYYLITLPFGMNEFRPGAPSQVGGGFLSAEPNDSEFGNLWAFSPGGESTCENLWGDVLGVWQSDVVRRTAGPTEVDCLAPIDPPPLAFFLRGCGVYSFTLEGRRLAKPLP